MRGGPGTGAEAVATGGSIIVGGTTLVRRNARHTAVAAISAPASTGTQGARRGAFAAITASQYASNIWLTRSYVATWRRHSRHPSTWRSTMLASSDLRSLSSQATSFASTSHIAFLR